MQCFCKLCLCFDVVLQQHCARIASTSSTASNSPRSVETISIVVILACLFWMETMVSCWLNSTTSILLGWKRNHFSMQLTLRIRTDRTETNRQRRWFFTNYSTLDASWLSNGYQFLCGNRNHHSRLLFEPSPRSSERVRSDGDFQKPTMVLEFEFRVQSIESIQGAASNKLKIAQIFF